MKWLNDCRMRLVLAGFVAAIVLCGGRASADFVIGDAELMDEAINHPSSTGINGFSLSHDGLRLYFSMRRDGGLGDFDIWVSERELPGAPWGEAVNLGPNINGPLFEEEPTISHDGLELYYWVGDKSSIPWQWQSMRSKRASKDEPWGPATEYTGIYPDDFSSDGLRMYFGGRWVLTGYGEGDIWMVTRGTLDEDWGDPVNLGPNVNDERRQGNPSISHDDLALFFNEDDALLVKMSVRHTTDGDWGPAIDISATLAPHYLKRYGPEISPDGRVLYFFHHPPFTKRKLWQAPITPIVDFNGDGIVDAADMCIMVDHWGTDNSLCDIGPMPWGDGVVDVEDLKVLAEHLFEDYRLLVAHWPLDEMDGMVVADRAGDNNGYALGDPIWQPTGGQVGGALSFDGVDDFISAPPVLNPADGPFSVLVWIKGGGPGQGIIAKSGGPAWLCLDPSEGHLMTELANAGRSSAPLVSQTVINDGDWHRIGLVWDGSNRILCVDEVVVAQDTQDSLESSGNGLYIGCGDPLQPSTFFSGLIDDVRIYTVP